MRYPLTKIKEGDVCAEVGVWKGDFSEEILKRKPSQLHLIDPWVHQDYESMWYSIPQEEMDDIFNTVRQRFSTVPNIVLHRSYSTSTRFPINFFDWVYIDGNHTYEQVVEDLEHYYPLMKAGGFLCGDDYNWTSIDCAKGPRPAVEEFVDRYQLPLEVRDNQYVIPVEQFDYLWSKNLYP